MLAIILKKVLWFIEYNYIYLKEIVNKKGLVRLASRAPAPCVILFQFNFTAGFCPPFFAGFRKRSGGQRRLSAIKLQPSSPACFSHCSHSGYGF
ncbi:MAG: hypothetical protein A2359_04970 [Candidatus Moranbacteria bacterium RIFOXYB1_FULL_43_19]|nr:MAG: hypothetical protein A2359_04970 [Candidatus Moranbacteria bacterium RIFOXYB1_FULL_43_19]OGI28046.1 MAG: hypothetical protein A2184_01815 [Candidatus Moranbacteria bacterium RIFOXYA1_FULL_44_7]OGI33605.1 MAG: hypothetical protein A2420_00600 [Candidatus Moranbacteria bacterium RIFOXYC1_FULL_44_13]